MKSDLFFMLMFASFAFATSVQAEDLLPNSCALYLKGVDPTTGKEKLHVCSGVARDNRTIFTAHHCVAPIVDLITLKPVVNKMEPVVVGCGYRGKSLEQICGGSDQQNAHDLLGCIQDHFDYGYYFFPGVDSVTPSNVTAAENFIKQYDIGINIAKPYLKSYLAATFSIDVARIDLGTGLFKFKKSTPDTLLKLKIISEDPEYAGYKKCRFEGFGEQGLDSMFYPKSIPVNYGDLTFESPISNFSSNIKDVMWSLEKLFGFSQILAKIPEARKGDSGGPFYCTKDNVTWDLIALDSQGNEKNQSATLSSFLSPQASRLFNYYKQQK